MQDAAKFWDNTAEKYSKSPIADEDSYRYTLERTRCYLSKQYKVLEIGCGTASTALILAPQVKHITASDLSQNMLAIGKEKAISDNIPNISFKNAEVLDIKASDGLYNAVLAFNIIHLLEDIPAAIHRIRDLLEPDGVFISKTVCLRGPETPFKYRFLKFILPIMQFFNKAPFVNLIEDTELETIIKTAGFDILESGNFPNRYIVARKI